MHLFIWEPLFYGRRQKLSPPCSAPAPAPLACARFGGRSQGRADLWRPDPSVDHAARALKIQMRAIVQVPRRRGPQGATTDESPPKLGAALLRADAPLPFTAAPRGPCPLCGVAPAALSRVRRCGLCGGFLGNALRAAIKRPVIFLRPASRGSSPDPPAFLCVRASAAPPTERHAARRAARLVPSSSGSLPFPLPPGGVPSACLPCRCACQRRFFVRPSSRCRFLSAATRRGAAHGRSHIPCSSINPPTPFKGGFTPAPQGETACRSGKPCLTAGAARRHALPHPRFRAAPCKSRIFGV